MSDVASVNGYSEDEGYITLPGGAIYGWTKQYHLFQIDPANRDVVEARVQEKQRMIRAGKDFLRECPIIVQDVNGTWVIRDGQHRWLAAVRERVVLYYVLSDRVNAEDVIAINNSQHAWSAGDRMKHFLAQGKPEYKALVAFMEKYPWIGLQVAINLCHYGDRAKMGFNDGTYTANDLTFAESVAKLCLRLKEYTPLWSTRPFIESMAACMELEGFEPDRLVDKVSMQTGEVKQHGRVEQYMEQWDRIYNKWQKEDYVFKIERINSGSRRRRPERRPKHTGGAR